MSVEVSSYLSSHAILREIIPESGAKEVLEPEFNLNEVPLASIAPLETVSIDSGSFSIAAHEMKHILAANGQFLFASIIPKGDSLGRTVFDGHIDLHNFRIAAAGSLVSDVLGNPVGTSGDEAVLAGTNRELAILEASSRISRYPVEIRGNLSKLLAIKREVYGHEFAQLKARAEFEERLKREGRYGDFIKAYYRKNKREKASTQQKGDLQEIINSLEKCYVIETLESGYEVITNYHYGREIDSIIRCAICGGINGVHNIEVHRFRRQEIRPFDLTKIDSKRRLQEEEMSPFGLGRQEDQPEEKRSGIIFRISKN